MLSFSNFGSTQHPSAQKMARAAELVKRRAPDLMVDGEMMADTAVSPEILEELYPFSSLKGGANLLVCPNLESANIAYKLLAKLGGAEMVGPILLGIRKPVYLLIPGNEVADIVNVTAMAVRDAQEPTDGAAGPSVKVGAESAGALTDLLPTRCDGKGLPSHDGRPWCN